MEVPVGVLYRWWKPAMPLHVFVVWYDCLISSLSVFGVFFLARALWRSDKAGVFASALYVALYPSYGRTVKNLFLREDFAIPLIIFALCFTVRALQDLKRRDQILAALFWLAALASWHLTQFVMAPLVVAAVLVYLGRGETPPIPWFVLTLAAGTFGGSCFAGQAGLLLADDVRVVRAGAGGLDQRGTETGDHGVCGLGRGAAGIEHVDATVLW